MNLGGLIEWLELLDQEYSFARGFGDVCDWSRPSKELGLYMKLDAVVEDMLFTATNLLGKTFSGCNNRRYIARKETEVHLVYNTPDKHLEFASMSHLVLDLMYENGNNKRLPPDNLPEVEGYYWCTTKPRHGFSGGDRIPVRIFKNPRDDEWGVQCFCSDYTRPISDFRYWSGLFSE